MKTIKIILTTLVTVLISLTGYSQKPNDIITQENYSDEFFKQLFVESLIQESSKYGITLIYNDDCDSAAKVVVNKSLSLGMVPIENPEILLITVEYVANKQGSVVGAGSSNTSGTILTNNMITFNDLVEARVNSYMTTIKEYSLNGDTILFGFNSHSFKTDSVISLEEFDYLVFITARD